MLKIFTIIVTAVLIGVGIYYGRYFFTKRVVNEEFPSATDQTTATPQPIKTGSFNEVDIIHKDRGQATLFAMGDKHILRFENFQVTNGPDLYVYLTKNP